MSVFKGWKQCVSFRGRKGGAVFVGGKLSVSFKGMESRCQFWEKESIKCKEENGERSKEKREEENVEITKSRLVFSKRSSDPNRGSRDG